MRNIILLLSVVLSLFTAISSCTKVLLYKKMFPTTHEAAQNFQLSAEFPDECAKVSLCAGFASALAADTTVSPNKMDFVNAFFYDKTNKSCRAGKVWNEFVKDNPVKTAIAGDNRLYLRSGCYFEQNYNFTAVAGRIVNPADLWYYYPGDGGNVAYYRSSLSPVAADRGLFPHVGGAFFNGGNTLKTTIANTDYRWTLPGDTVITDLSILAWFHGRGEKAKKPVATISRDDDWNYDHATLFAGTLGTPEKLCFVSLDTDSSHTGVCSDVTVSYDRWTHLAVTFSGVTGKASLYINGVTANAPGAYDLTDLTDVRTVHLGYRGEDNSKCNCDIAEVEIYTGVLTGEEIVDSYSKHIIGPDCPD